MKIQKIVPARMARARSRFVPVLSAIAACSAFLACTDDEDHNSGAGSSPNGMAGSSGRGGSSTSGGGRAGNRAMPEGDKAGEAGDAGGEGGSNTNAGGGAGEMAEGGSAGVDSGAAGQGGDGGVCGAGYSQLGETCVAACAPRDFDGASIALSVGHADVIAAAYDAASELALFVSDDSFPVRQLETVRRAPASVLVHGKASAIIQVPDIPALTGILDPGTDVWLLPEGAIEAEAAGIIWPGMQSYGVEQGELQGDQVTLRLVSIEGDGKFVGFATVQDELTPPELFFDPANGLNEFSLPASTHLHLNWAFTQGGLHRLTFELEATPVGGNVVKSSQHTYRFFFGELADLPATEPTIIVPEGLESSYALGGELVLTATRYGAPSPLPTSWSRQCYDPVTFEPAPWEALGSGETLTTVATPGCQYVACLMNQATPVAISQAVSATFE